jgi:monoamine oxidase
MTQIAVVGAGLAGLNAALTLQDAGLACTVYEASQRIGGRIHSDATTWADGMVGERCGEFIDADHVAMHQLIRRFGLRTTDLRSGRTDMSRSLMYFGHRYYRAEELGEDWQSLLPLLQQQYRAAGFPTTYAHYTPEGARLDHLSVTEWIERYIPGGPVATLGRLLDAGCTGFYGLDSREQSALNLVYLFGSPDPARGTLPSGPPRPSRKIVGGNAQLPLALTRSLPEGGTGTHG